MSNLINPNELVETSNDSNDEKIRLMVCPVCKSIDPLPMYDGPDEYDETGQAKATMHMFGDGRFHPFIVGTVSEKSWENPRTRSEIVKKVSSEVSPGEGVGLGDELYDVRSNYSEEAMKCWRIEHNRTKDCGDWKIERKRLIPHTQAERKAEGMPHRARDIQSKTYLCDFCVMRSVKQNKVNDAKGLNK